MLERISRFTQCHEAEWRRQADSGREWRAYAAARLKRHVNSAFQFFIITIIGSAAAWPVSRASDP
jgi:hypothetical protein